MGPGLRRDDTGSVVWPSRKQTPAGTLP